MHSRLLFISTVVLFTALVIQILSSLTNMTLWTIKPHVLYKIVAKEYKYITLIWLILIFSTQNCTNSDYTVSIKQSDDLEMLLL